MIDTLKQLLGLDEAAPAAASGEEHEIELAVAALLVEMSRADHDQTEAERQVAQQVLEQHLELPVAEARALLQRADAAATTSVSLYDFTSALHQALDDEQRIEILKLLWRVALADGQLDKYEEYLVRKIADLLYVPHAGYIQAKLAVLEAGNG